MNSKILITGGAGYIGSKLANKLTADGFEVVVIDDLSTGKRENISRTIKFYEMSILNKKLGAVLKKEKPDVIFHLAASKSVNDSLNNPVEFAQVNIMGSVNVISSAHKAGIKRVIFTSTAGVYGTAITDKKQNEKENLNPSSPYAWTKLSIEQYMDYMTKAYGMENIILRFANVYGSGAAMQKSVVDIFIKNALSENSIVIHGKGTQTRDFIFIDDLIDICGKLIHKKLPNNLHSFVFNISTGKEVSISDLVEKIKTVSKKPLKIKYEPHVFIGQKRSVLDTSKAKKILDWEAKTSLDQGIRIIVSEFVHN